MNLVEQWQESPKGFLTALHVTAHSPEEVWRVSSSNVWQQNLPSRGGGELLIGVFWELETTSAGREKGIRWVHPEFQCPNQL
jgi:hypothetical protein